MGVGPQNHPAAAGHGLTVIGVDICQIGRYIDAAVLMRCRKGKLVVVLIDGAADSTERVMAVGEHIGEREFLHPGGSCRLDNADIGNVMAGHGIELQSELIHVFTLVMGFDDGICHRALFCFGLVYSFAGESLHFRAFTLGNKLCPLYQIYAAFIKFDHKIILQLFL